MRPSSISAKVARGPADQFQHRRRQPRQPDTYLIVESGGFAGNTHCLKLPLPRRWFWPWVRTRSVVLDGSDGQRWSWAAVLDQARAEVASVYGPEGARAARFQVLWDGSL